MLYLYADDEKRDAINGNNHVPSPKWASYPQYA